MRHPRSDAGATPLTAMRRRDRGVDDESWIHAMLHGAPLGVLATVADGWPFLNPNLFVFHERRRAIYVHTARTGRTRDNVEGDSRASFTVSELGRLLPADTALEFSCEYASVIVFGRGTVVTDPAEARDALQLLLDKYFGDLAPGRDYRPITDDELKRTSVYRLDVQDWIGKKKQVEPDFPGARPWRPPREARGLG